MKGGYVMINLTSSRLFKEINEAMTLDKPYLIYGDDIPYFADSITYDSNTNTYTIAKGGQLMVIDSENNITKTGDKDGALLSSIVDDNGNQRFIEGSAVLEDITGITVNYNKWSLSGTHLMIVLGASVADTTSIVSNTKIATYNLPEYILDKITALYSNSVVSSYQFTLYADDGTSQACNVSLYIYSGYLEIRLRSNVTLTDDRNFRIQFDLLIDTE